MLWVILVASFLAGVFFIYGVYLILASEKMHIQFRLENIKKGKRKDKDLDEELQKPFLERIVRPLLSWLATGTKRFTPAKKRAVLEKKITLAGSPGRLSTTEFMVLHYTMAVILGIVGYAFGYLGHWGPLLNIVWGLWGLFAGYFLVYIYLDLKIKYRQSEITADLPDVLDLLTVSVEAGLGFDAALQRVIQKTKGAISMEFAKTLQEIKMGKQRREALKDLGLRTGVDDLSTFISAIVQADQLGVSIGNVLRIQSEQMRRKRRQRIEEKAMKAPIKMLIPMVLFIFPTIFIVLLGPAAIQMWENLAH